MSEITNLMPPPDADLVAARRQFVELYGTPLIAASWPLVIRINDVGRAEAVFYDSLTYRPQDAESAIF